CSRLLAHFLPSANPCSASVGCFSSRLLTCQEAYVSLCEYGSYFPNFTASDPETGIFITAA
ncbi:unnamed protein product, partial [Bubo scandiacus]